MASAASFAKRSARKRATFASRVWRSFSICRLTSSSRFWRASAIDCAVRRGASPRSALFILDLLSRGVSGPASPPSRSGRLQVDGGRLALLAPLDIEAHFLAFLKIADAGAFDRGDVHEDIFRAVLGLNEAVTLCRVEPFDRTDGHPSLHKKSLRRGRAEGQPTFLTGPVRPRRARRQGRPKRRLTHDIWWREPAFSMQPDVETYRLVP